MTEADLGQELVEMGVPKEDIVLELHPQYKRRLTGYGVGGRSIVQHFWGEADTLDRLLY
jgi:hypothetical protein